MANPRASRFGRLQTTDARDGGVESYLADVPETVRLTIGTAQSSARHVVRGAFEMLSIYRTHATAINASAKTVQVGTSASVTRFGSATLSAGAANERTEIAPASAAVPDWILTGSAEAATTVRVAFSDASAVAANMNVTVTYVRRG